MRHNTDPLLGGVELLSLSAHLLENTAQALLVPKLFDGFETFLAGNVPENFSQVKFKELLQILDWH